METPPSDIASPLVDTALGVLNAQASALTHIASLYGQQGLHQTNFFRCLDILQECTLRGGKVIFTAMGKSLKIGEKLAATLNSLGITSCTLHPTEALHGDLGVIGEIDVLIMITASGNTPELLTLMPHLPVGLKWLCLTCNAQSPLARAASGVLEAPVEQMNTELEVYGLAAPTVTTTACLAVGDAMCITLNEMLIASAKSRAQRFGKWHPGGAIGAMYRPTLVGMSEIIVLDQGIIECSELDLWRASSCHKFILDGFDIYSSKDVVEWLKNGRYSLPPMVDMRSLPQVEENVATDHGSMCVVVKGAQQIGLMVCV